MLTPSVGFFRRPPPVSRLKDDESVESNQICRLKVPHGSFVNARPDDGLFTYQGLEIGFDIGAVDSPRILSDFIHVRVEVHSFIVVSTFKFMHKLRKSARDVGARGRHDDESMKIACDPADELSVMMHDESKQSLFIPRVVLLPSLECLTFVLCDCPHV